MMKKVIVLASLLAMFSSGFADEGYVSANNTSPLKLSVWPGVWTWPDGTIYGMSWGLPASYSDNKEAFIGGVDMAILLSQTTVKGAQISLLNMGEGSVGAQVAVANMQVNKFNGAQIGVYNDFTSSKGLQLGVINKGTQSKGVQIGLVNFMEGGFFPVFPLFNFNCKSEPVQAPVSATTTATEARK